MYQDEEDPLMRENGLDLSVAVFIHHPTTRTAALVRRHVFTRVEGGQLYGATFASVAEMRQQGFFSESGMLTLALEVTLPRDFLQRSEHAKMPGDFYWLMMSGVGADVKIWLAGGEAYAMAHKLILLARCPVYRNATWLKTDTNVPLDWKKYSADAGTLVLRYLYTGALDHKGQDPDTVLDALMLAMELQLSNLAFFLVAALEPKDSEKIRSLSNLYLQTDAHASTYVGQVAQQLLARIVVAPAPPMVATASSASSSPSLWRRLVMCCTC